MIPYRCPEQVYRAAMALCLSAVLIMQSTHLQAIDFEYGEAYGSFDTTVSYGQTHRTQSPATELIGLANGGTAFSVNGDDGNLNYDSGIVSNTVKFTSELEINYRNFGLFLRGTGFRDNANNDRTGTDRTFLSNEAIELVGEDLKLLDAYIWGNFEIGKMPLDIRLGRQVISWGESTFIQNSINVINPVDVSKLRVPGAELKEALLPVGIVSASLGITDNVSLDAFYQYDYERILIDPPGSYFSTNDFAGNGGNCVALGFGAVPDYPLLALSDGLTNTCAFAGTAIFSAPRSADDRPDEGGQYGAALRVYAPVLNDTEFGFYYVNYHSRLPLINAITPAIFTAPVNVFGATYFLSYPEDIDLFGVSFNTQLGTTGWALQGEYSFRNDAPLQVDDVELLAAALGFDTIGIPSQLGTFAAGGTVVPGFIERDVSQFQATATKIYGNVLKANQVVVLGEFAVTHVHDMPSAGTLRLDAAGTNLPGGAATATVFGVPVETNDFADATSWGYRLVGRLTYNNVIGAINLSPRIGWRHDVSGNSPGPGGNFIEGFKQLTLGLAATYQNAWKADLSYSTFFGAGSQNLLQDRDFMAVSISYSF